MADWPDIAVVIVTWNSARWIPSCLDALAQSRYEGRLRAWVVDNASADGSPDIAERHPIGCHVIRNQRNLGFGGANNVGWRAAASDIVVFLNPDTEVRPGWLAPLAERFQGDSSIAIAGCKLAYPGGRVLQHAGGVLYDNAMADHLGAGREDQGQFDTPCDVDYVTGAAMAVRRSFLESTGGFDDRFYPAYYEETDLCVIARMRGLRVVYEPRAEVIHHESVSVVRGSSRFLELFLRGRVQLLAKHFTSADWLLRFLPFELRWMRQWLARGLRARVVRSYATARLGLDRGASRGQ